MFFVEALQDALTADDCASRMGLHPVLLPKEARAAGIYPVTVEVPEGYTAGSYRKVGDHYEAIPLPVSNGELAMVETLRKHKVDHTKLKQLVVPAWSADHTYQPGDEVQHNGKLYRKDNDDDQTVPDEVAGGWSEVR